MRCERYGDIKCAVTETRNPKLHRGNIGNVAGRSSIPFQSDRVLCAVSLFGFWLSCIRHGERLPPLELGERHLIRTHPSGVRCASVVEVTIVSRDANVMLLSGAQIAILNARVDGVVKGTLDGNVLKVVTYLDGCTRIGVGHGFIAGTLRRDAQRGLELLAIQHPFIRARPTSEGK